MFNEKKYMNPFIFFADEARIILTGVAVTVVSIIIVFGMMGCQAATRMEAPAISDSFTESELDDDNELLIFFAKGLINQDPVFRQGLSKLTAETYDVSVERPVEDYGVVDMAYSQLVELMRKFLWEYNSYRNGVAALIFSALDMEARQSLVDALDPEDPMFSDSEILGLLPGITIGGRRAA